MPKGGHSEDLFEKTKGNDQTQLTLTTIEFEEILHSLKGMVFYLTLF